MTRAQRQFLLELKAMDDLGQGCLEVSRACRTPEQTELACKRRGWIRTAPWPLPWGRVMYLTTKGLRALQR